MPIKNYTTKVDSIQSVGEIQAALVKAGASKIMVDYDNSCFPLAVTFALPTQGGLSPFTLIAPVEGTMTVFNRQKVKTDRKQAERTAWRNVRDWVLAQLAYMEASNVEAAQVFLPYLTNRDGQTLYQMYQNNQLMLGEGGTKNAEVHE